MALKSSEEMFHELRQNDNFHLVDLNQKLPLYYGIDKRGRFSLCYQSEKLCGDLSGTKVLDIVSGPIGGGKYATFLSLSDEGFKSAFFSLCDDIIYVLNNIVDNESGFVIFVDRIKTWKKMFANKPGLLSDQVIQGLYGELYFLDNFMFQKYGMEKAMKAWGGPQGLPKDFSVDLDWYEVKCINLNKDKVVISSAQQLESENPGNLVVIKVESEPEGFNNGVATINQLFKKISGELSNLPNSLDFFIDCLTKRGFSPDEEYDKHRFNVVSMDFYVVDERFPHITLSEDNQQAIGKITYELMLNSLKKYLKEEE